MNSGKHVAHYTEGKDEAQQVIAVLSAKGKTEVCRSQSIFSPELTEKEVHTTKVRAAASALNTPSRGTNTGVSSTQ